jgi:tRNA nucleotidyltransferase (CCA-adding enzyme)
MQLYAVGGAVRDEQMGLADGAPNDRDWVAVGATPQDLLSLGYRPVGKDFPVFLHPETGEEVALARTERKSAPGYHGFVFHAAPDVTLEQDLARRDLTINAMARAADGTLIDPFGGRRDLAAKVLRHVSPAFVEDPVRLLRVARFAARWPDFTVAPETMALLASMVEAGEVDALVPERVWQELARGLLAPRPSRMFEVLRACGALARLLPEVDALWGVPQPQEHHPEVDTGVHLMLVLDMAARLGAPLAVRWACLGHDLGKAETPSAAWPRHLGHEARGVRRLGPLHERLRVPNDCRELAVLMAREHVHLHQSGRLGAAALVRLFDRCDAWRRPERFGALLLGCECDARGRAGREEIRYEPARRLPPLLQAARAVDTGAALAAAAARGARGPALGAVVRSVREQAVQAALCEHPALSSPGSDA